MMMRPGIDHIIALIERWHRRPGAAAQICVIHRGNVVLDRAVACSPNALFLVYSASKPFLARLLAERGQLKLDDPVAKYWPEFAAKGRSRSVMCSNIGQAFRWRAA